MPESNRTRVRLRVGRAHKSLSMKECFVAPAGAPIAPTAAFGYLMTVSEGVLVGLARRKSALGTRRARRGLASLPVGPDRLRRRAFACRPADRHALPAGAGRAGGAGLRARRRSPPISRRSSATPPASAPISTTRARPRRTRRAIIATTNVRCAGLPLRRRRSCRPTPRACPDGSNAGRHTIGAAPDFGAFSACPAQRNRARAPPLAV